jgi:hypothetical protein
VISPSGALNGVPDLPAFPAREKPRNTAFESNKDKADIGGLWRLGHELNDVLFSVSLVIVIF